AQRRKIERAQRAADRRAKSGKLKDVVARFQSDEESQGPAAPQMSPRSATLFRLAGELQTAPGADTAALLGILQELERIPATVELLRRTQLGIITQPYKDHGDPEIRAIAKRLRRSWKDLIAAAAGEASAQQAAPPPPPAERE
ncbi:Tcea1, partial [Symbiodinium pilosum]